MDTSEFLGRRLSKQRCNFPFISWISVMQALVLRTFANENVEVTISPLSLFATELMQMFFESSFHTCDARRAAPKVTSVMRSWTHFKEHVWRSLSWPKPASRTTCSIGRAATTSANTSKLSLSNCVLILARLRALGFFKWKLSPAERGMHKLFNFPAYSMTRY